MAGFSTAVTGLKASTTMLDVAGNNIANSSTVGFKSSRTEFGDIYATAVVGAGSSNTPGSGVTVSDIAQDFSAGTIEFTNNNLDLAINGSGFFQLDDGQGSVTYTRAGAFELDKNGNIISKTGKFLQGYGLDSDGNRLPIGNLSVTQKESPPKATETIDLSFNIDDSEDASKLLPVYDKDEPGSFTYTTTVRTFDSLGNEHTIKFNFAEQRPVRNVFEYSYPATPVASHSQTINGANDTYDLYYADDGTVVARSQTSGNFYQWDASTPEVINDGTVPTAYAGTVASAVPVQQSPVTVNISGQAIQFIQQTTGADAGTWIPDPALTDQLDDLSSADPRIDVNSLSYNGTNLEFELNAWATDSGDLVVTGGGAPLTRTAANLADPYRDANEERTYAVSATNADGKITIGGVDITIDNTQDSRQIATSIEGAQAEILDRNPAIESIQAVTVGSENRIVIRFKADQGDISDTDYQPTVTLTGGSLTLGQETFDTTTPSGTVTANSTVEGDNTYQGYYRTYAYLNGEELLDLGKKRDPGEPGAADGQTEEGPILIQFNPTNGLLRSINGSQVVAGGQVPSITISGADPANSLTKIDLDLTGSTQFASPSIVKSQLQDGYTKGDLIGVTFAGTGEMIASFSNGQNQSLGVVAVATFENQSGLQPSGDTEWIATLDSGDAILNPPGTGLNGTLRSAALEASNVDLSEELVKLIEGQRNFQANSKTLETLNAVTQTILQI